MAHPEERYARLKQTIDEGLLAAIEGRNPESLYNPTRHVLEAGGKRVRAILTLLTAEATGGSVDDALKPALAVEILHNFTLVHDDIMDSAFTRRGRPTVHAKWDVGTAVLVGDVMIGLAQHLLVSSAGTRCTELLDAFSRGIVDVCEGQALDRDFEVSNSLSTSDYLGMISMKTGRLVEMATEIGAIVGGGSPEQVAALQKYAHDIGLAFQIQDDLLDIAADEERLGKKIGGDVVEGKRTYLVVRAIERGLNGQDDVLLSSLLDGPGVEEARVPDVRDMFERNGILDDAREEVRKFGSNAVENLKELPPSDARSMLEWLAQMLMNRDH